MADCAVKALTDVASKEPSGERVQVPAKYFSLGVQRESTDPLSRFHLITDLSADVEKSVRPFG